MGHPFFPSSGVGQMKKKNDSPYEWPTQSEWRAVYAERRDEVN
jgi:hypothetical protein